MKPDPDDKRNPESRDLGARPLETGPESRKARRLDLFWVLLAASIAAFPFLNQDANWAAREVRHAAIAHHIYESGDYLVPKRLGEVYHDKPPVMHSLAALLFSWRGGASLGLARLPTALASLFGALALYGLGLMFTDSKTARWAAVALAGSFGWVRMAVMARPDMIYSAAILGACAGLCAVMKRDRKGGRGLLVAAGLLSGLAVVTKGPLAWLFPLAFAVILKRSGGGVFRGLPVREWMIFSSSAMALPLIWAALAFARSPDYLHGVVFQPDLVSGSSHHARPFYWYLPNLFLSLLPLSVLWPLRGRSLWVNRGPLLMMTLLILLVLSLIPGKRLHYLLPLIPFAVLATTMDVFRVGTAAPIRHFFKASVLIALIAPSLFFVVMSERGEGGVDPKKRRAEAVLSQATHDDHIVCIGGFGDELDWTQAATGMAPSLEIGEAPDISTALVAVRAFRSRGKNVSVFGKAKDIDRLQVELNLQPIQLKNDWRSVDGKWRCISLL